MILLVVVLLFAGSAGEQGWVNGDYSRQVFEFPSIAACESARNRSIANAHTNPVGVLTLLSKCATGNDAIQFDVYLNPGSTTKPVTPQGKDSA